MPSHLLDKKKNINKTSIQHTVTINEHSKKILIMPNDFHCRLYRNMNVLLYSDLGGLLLAVLEDQVNYALAL